MEMTREAARLEQSRRRLKNWKRWGPYLSERAWGTVREDYSPGGSAWDYFPHDHARSTRLPLERGRPRRHLRPPSAHLLRARALERPRPDSQGAPLRPDRQRRQPRRGRQGVLLLPRQHAHAFLHEVPLQVPAGGVSLRETRAKRTAGAARGAAGVRAASTRASSTRIATSTSFVEYAKADVEDILDPHSRQSTAGRRRAAIHVLPTIWFRNTWSWDDGRAAPVA